MLRDESVKKLSARFTCTENPSEAFCVQYSPDSKLMAAGCDDGVVRVFNAESGKLAYSLNTGTINAMPITSIRFRPHAGTSKTKNVLVSVNADGLLQHWHITSGRCLHESIDPKNPLFCMDFRDDAEVFATAGKDFAVRIYDEATKSLVQTMGGGDVRWVSGHSNRVFSLKFNPSDANIIVSGGWDNTVQIWDIRTGKSERSIFGPHICGDSVDIFNNVIMTGSWRNDSPLELWDLHSGKLIEQVTWHQGKKTMAADDADACMLYAAKFNQNGTLIGAGGSGTNEAKVFDRKRDNATIGTIAGLSRGVYGVAWGADDVFAVAGGDKNIRVFKVEGGRGVGATESKVAEEDGMESKMSESKASGLFESTLSTSELL